MNRNRIEMLLPLFGLTLLLARPAISRAATLYVSPQGRDVWSGTLEKPNAAQTDGPLPSLMAARNRIRALRAGGSREAMTVLVRSGTYYLSEPFVVKPEDSGSAESPVVYAAYPNELPVLSGGKLVGGWKQAPGKPGTWMADVPEVKTGRWYFHQLFVGGQRRQRARTPNEGFFQVEGEISTDSPARFKFHAGDLRPGWAGSEAEFIGLNKWQSCRQFFKAIDIATNTATLSQRRLPSSEESDSRYWIENTPDVLDAPGEWYLNRREGVVYYIPLPGEDLARAEVVAPMLKLLVAFDGNKDNYVHHVTLRGLTLSYADWSISPAGDAWHQAADTVPAAMKASGARACAVEHCLFSHLGGYAIAFDKGSTENRIIGNELADLGAGGVKLGDVACGVHPIRKVGESARDRAGEADLVRRTGSRWPLDPADYRADRAFPHSEAEATRRNVLEDNRVHDIGSVLPGAVGIWVGQSCGNTIAHNEIFNTYFSGISCGWTWGFGPTAARNNTIELNHIHHIGRGLLFDMGGIYTLGVQPGTVLRSNLIHDVHRYDAKVGYGGWGIYLDSTSSQIRVEKNVIYHNDDGSIQQNAGQQNTIVNNILALNREAQFTRSNPAPKLSFTFEHNIIYYETGDLFRAALDPGKYAFDYNLYYRRGGQEVTFGRSISGSISLAQWHQRGQDQHSLVADPLFVDPEHGDFSLKADSPAFKLGIEAIDISTVGPRQPAGPPIKPR